MSVKSYQQLPKLPPPPPSPRTKPSLKKTVSAPQAALSRLLGSSRGAPEESRGDGEGDGGGRAPAKRRSKNKRPIDVGEDVLASETPPSASPPLPPRIPEGNLIDLDTDDASSTSESPSATSLSSQPPSFRSCSVGNADRPSPQPPPSSASPASPANPPGHRLRSSQHREVVSSSPRSEEQTNPSAQTILSLFTSSRSRTGPNLTTSSTRYQWGGCCNETGGKASQLSSNSKSLHLLHSHADQA